MVSKGILWLILLGGCESWDVLFDGFRLGDGSQHQCLIVGATAVALIRGVLPLSSSLSLTVIHGLAIQCHDHTITVAVFVVVIVVVWSWQPSLRCHRRRLSLSNGDRVVVI